MDGPDLDDRDAGWRTLSRLLATAKMRLPRTDFFKALAEVLGEVTGADGVWLCLDSGASYRLSSPEPAQAGPHDFTNLITACCDQREKCLDYLGPILWVGDSHPKLAVCPLADAARHLETSGVLGTVDLGRGEPSRSMVLLALGRDFMNVDSGLCALFSRQPGFFRDTDQVFLRNLARSIGIAVSNWQSSWALRERVKELTCLYDMAHLVDAPDLSLDDLLMEVVKFLPSAWLYPDEAFARLQLDNRVYALPEYPEGRLSLAADLVIQGRRRGFVEIVYGTEKPALDEGPFLQEERKLLEAVARELALIIDGQLQEKQLGEMKEQLQHANRLSMIGQLAAAVAHEINEPLTNIIGYAELAGKCPGLPDQAVEDVGRIVSISLHAREIVRKLMIFAHKMPSTLQVVDINETINESLGLFRSRCLKDGLMLTFEPGAEAVLVRADANHLRQIVVNLVLNSMQATPPGGKIGLRTAAGSTTVTLTVTDSGAGMSDEIRDKVFIPFFTTKRPGQGTGLGLSVVREIVDSYQGRIDITSQPGRGTAVSIELPRHDRASKENGSPDHV